jgi:thiol-disulfide isomerase/thioredoxin
VAKTARAENARLTQLRREQQVAERRRRLWIAGGALALVVVIIVAVVVAALNAPKKSNPSAQESGPVSTAVSTALAGIPAATFDAVGAGTADTRSLTMIQADPLVADGKPRVVYVGAEYCPFCASERWALVSALERFGDFTGLGNALSSATDQPASVPTLTLKDAKYTSSYLSFDAYEVQDRAGKPLQSAPSDIQALQAKYGGASIPWIYLGGKAVQSGSSVDGNLLIGKGQEQIAAALADPSSDIAKSVDGGANLLTVQLCRLTSNQPSDVCSSAGVLAAATKLK